MRLTSKASKRGKVDHGRKRRLSHRPRKTASHIRIRKGSRDEPPGHEPGLEAIIDRTPFMLTRCGADLRYRFVSPAYAEMLGRKPEDVVGKRIVEIMGEEGFRMILPHVERVLAGHRVEYESAVHFEGVGARLIQVVYVPETDHAGRVTGWLASIVDITDWKRAERRLLSNLAISEILAESPALDDAVVRVLQMVGETLGWAVGAVWTPDPETNALRCFKVWSADGDRFAPFEAAGRKCTFSHGAGLPGRVWAVLKPVWIADVMRDPNFPRAPFAAAQGLHGAFAFPILFGEKFLGVMEFFSHEIREPDQALLAMFGIIGAQIGQFIQRKRAERNVAEAARVQAALYRFIERRHRAESLVEIYNSALDAILEALQCERASILLFDAGGVMRFAAWRGLSETYRQAVEGHSPWKRDATNPEPIFINNIDTAELSDSLKAVVKGEGIGALAFIPLVSRGRLVGKFMTYFNAPHAFESDQLGLALTIARQIVFGVERNRAEEALREAHALLADKASHLEGLVQQRTARLQETVADLEAFSYTVAHDLRAPLRAMQGYAEVLVTQASTSLSPQHQNYLQRIQRAAARLDTLTREVLGYSQLSRREVTLQPVDLEKLLRDIREEYPQLRGTDCIEIRSPLLAVLGHGGLLSQTLSNLLINACKFITPGKTPKVVVRTEEAGEQVRLWVEDNGIGIAPEHRDRLFKIFGRIHPDHKYEGTGIGLAIVKKAAERMGGTAGFESEVGKGSRFWVQLKKGSFERLDSASDQSRDKAAVDAVSGEEDPQNCGGRANGVLAATQR
jgi:PAS domain S-box-containing protein